MLNRKSENQERMIIISDIKLAKTLDCEIHSCNGREFGVVRINDEQPMCESIANLLDFSLEIV